MRKIGPWVVLVELIWSNDSWQSHSDRIWLAETCAASQATTDCKFLYQTEAQQRWIFHGYGCYLLCSTPHFVPLIAALLILCNACKKMFLLGIPAGQLLQLEKCSMCCLGSSHNAKPSGKIRWYYISNSYQSLSQGETTASSLWDYSLIECWQFINHSTHVLRSVYPKRAAHVWEITHPDSGSIPNWTSKV